jgi:cation:H+ antiporter
MPSPEATGRFAALAPWQMRLAGTAACTLPGLLVRAGGALVPSPVQLVAYGAAVAAAAFMLAWASEAAQVDFGHGIVVVAVAFVAILPEYIVEAHFAFTGQAEYVTANLTGAIRLLLGFCVGMPAALALLPDRWRPRNVGPLELPASHRVELATLGLGAAWALRPVIRGELTLVDAVVLVSLYGLYLRRVTKADSEGSELIGVAAGLAELPRQARRRWVRGLMAGSGLVIVLTAVPFGDAVLHTGALVGISPFLLLQWLVPVATEMPELLVAIVLLVHGRAGQSVAVLLASATSQYTLALGTLPIAFALGGGKGHLQLGSREQIELFLTVGVALYAVAALLRLRISRGDAGIMLVLFTIQFLLPAVLARLALGVVFLTLAVDILIADRRRLRPVAAALGR